MSYSELANFIENVMRMQNVYQPVALGLMLEAQDGVVTAEQAEEAFAAVLGKDEHRLDERYPFGVLAEHEVIEILGDDGGYRLLGFTGLTKPERTALLELCDAKLQVFLARGGSASSASEGPGPGRLYILRSRGTPDLFKIGYTTVRAAYRAREISRGTGVPFPFSVYYETIWVADAYQREQQILTEFADARPNSRKEFLEIRVIGEVLERLPPRERTDHENQLPKF